MRKVLISSHMIYRCSILHFTEYSTKGRGQKKIKNGIFQIEGGVLRGVNFQLKKNKNVALK